MLEKFLQAIHEKRYLSVDFIAKEDNLLRNRKCVPFDYGESRRYKDGKDRFHFLDLCFLFLFSSFKYYCLNRFLSKSFSH